ncbi:MAG: tetratricopeptide repeat protein [Hyphomicrobiaceae bacterium]
MTDRTPVRSPFYAAVIAASITAAALLALPASVRAEPPAAAPQAEPDAAPAKPHAGSLLPSTPEERERILSNLYAHLATAETEERAKEVSQTIERLWLYSGSDTINLLMDRAQKAVGEKNYDLALRFLDNIVVLAPDYAEGWNRRAYVYFLKNDVQRSLGDLRRVLALEPNHFKALEGLAQILREIGQKKAALQVFKQLLTVNPYYSGARQAVDELSRDVDGQGI